MADQEQLARLKGGVANWNQWRAEHPRVMVTLSEADLSETVALKIDLRWADLREANILSADLRAGNLREANLRKAALRGADLCEANLSGADLFKANLAEANLRSAGLTGADLRSTDLRKTDFTKAVLSLTNFADTNLSMTEGLEYCVHRGPSTVGIDTFFQSKGAIPEIFLRGCGVPEQFITYSRSLIGQAIEFYSCFISYSAKDQEFADRLYADLQNNAVRCWFAPHDIAGGKKVHEQIDEAIRVYDRLLLILSDHSIKSNWVETEISKARKRELREGRRMLFPLRLIAFEALHDWECFDADTGKDSAREIREYFIPDFCNWKDHDSYKEGFDRLLRDLKSTDRAVARPK